MAQAARRASGTEDPSFHLGTDFYFLDLCSAGYNNDKKKKSVNQAHIRLSRFCVGSEYPPMGGSPMDGDGCWSRPENAETFLS